MSNQQNPLRLNVGFITHQPVGYSREFFFDFPHLSLSSDLDLNTFSGQARITRTPQGLLAQAQFQAETSLECVRCLTTCQQSLQINFTELFYFSKRNLSETDLILPENGHIDLEPLVREYFILDIPINSLCKPDCLGLCPICGSNRNEEPCHHETQDVDPRLEALQALLDE